MTTPDQNLLEQLQQLKCMTVRLGLIHEAQKIQVQNYPLVMTDIKGAVTKVDVEGQTVTYDLRFKSPRRPGLKTIQPQMEMVVRWVRTVLWDDTSVHFTSKGKALMSFVQRNRNV